MMRYVALMALHGEKQTVGQIAIGPPATASLAAGGLAESRREHLVYEKDTGALPTSHFYQFNTAGKSENK